MTPSTDPTLGGFVQGLQGNEMEIIGSLLTIIFVLLIVRWLITKLVKGGEIKDSDANIIRSWANGIASVAAVVVLASFIVSAATYATNAIPRSDLDKSSVYDQMNSNIKH